MGKLCGVGKLQGKMGSGKVAGGGGNTRLSGKVLGTYKVKLEVGMLCGVGKLPG